MQNEYPVAFLSTLPFNCIPLIGWATKWFTSLANGPVYIRRLKNSLGHQAGNGIAFRTIAKHIGNNNFSENNSVVKQISKDYFGKLEMKDEPTIFSINPVASLCKIIQNCHSACHVSCDINENGWSRYYLIFAKSDRIISLHLEAFMKIIQQLV